MTHVPNSSPYPWPFDGVLLPERTALIVVGWDSYWLAAADEVEAAVANVERLAEYAASTYVVAHRPPGRESADGLPAREPGAGGEPPAIAGQELWAEGVDAFYGSALEATLRRRGLDKLLIVGLGLETTVHSTVRTANDIGLECLVVVDACAPLDPTIVARSISMIEMSGGIFGAVANTDDVVETLIATHQS